MKMMPNSIKNLSIINNYKFINKYKFNLEFRQFWKKLGGLLLAFLLMSCSNLTKEIIKDPEVSLQEIKMQNFSFEKVQLVAHIQVKNPNPIPLKIDSVDYKLKLGSEEVTSGVLDKGLDIESNSEKAFQIPLEFKLASIGNLMGQFLQNKKTKQEYEVTGHAKWGLISIPFTKKGDIDLSK